MFQLKSLSMEGITAALDKAERYRLLNEPREAESICLDVLEIDPENRTIRNCPNSAPPFVACLQTLRVATGYSQHLKVDGKRVCLDTVTGFTTGTPPGAVLYFVRAPGQQLVSEVG